MGRCGEWGEPVVYEGAGRRGGSEECEREWVSLWKERRLDGVWQKSGVETWR